MFEQKLAQEAESREKITLLDSQAQDFLNVWRAMKDEVKDPARLKRLEVKVDMFWQKLSQEAKDAVWTTCFPEHRRVKEVFDAHAVTLRGGEFR